ncbi:MAG: DUF6941 family protein [Candidatus Dormibacteria bacterium]
MPEVEFVILANHIEALNGLLYVSGGGWTDHYRPMPPGSPDYISHLGIGVSAVVPWTDTNVQYQLVVRLETEDGKDVFEVLPTLVAGRPPNLPPGSDQRVVYAMNVEITFPHAGGYRILARIEGVNSPRSVTFRVHDVPLPKMEGSGSTTPPAG